MIIKKSKYVYWEMRIKHMSRDVIHWFTPDGKKVKILIVVIQADRHNLNGRVWELVHMLPPCFRGYLRYSGSRRLQ